MESMGILSKVYRERAAEVAHRLAAERAKAAEDAATSVREGGGDESGGALTLPGWGRAAGQKRKLDEASASSTSSLSSSASPSPHVSSSSSSSSSTSSSSSSAAAPAPAPEPGASKSSGGLP